MSDTATGLRFRERMIGSLAVPILEFTDVAQPPQCIPVTGYIANSIPTSRKGKERLDEWKVRIARRVKAERGGKAWDSGSLYAISLALRFCLALHGGRRLDVENFIKPILDATAAGLFMPDSQDAASIERWDFDDSNFNTLLIHRLPDTQAPNAEGVAIFVSRR